MVVIDTDVLLLEFAYHRDLRHEANKNFLEQVSSAQPATTIYNLMELLGQMSFNVPARRLAQWNIWLIDVYKLTLLFPEASPNESADSFYRNEIVERPFAKIRKEKMPYRDALALDLAERAPNVEYFVTWNAKHFKNKSSLQVVTPIEYLELASTS